MGRLVHTGLGSSSLVAHVLPPRKQLCTRSCSNKHTHTHSPPPHANSFVKGTAVINTHTHTSRNLGSQPQPQHSFLLGELGLKRKMVFTLPRPARAAPIRSFLGGRVINTHGPWGLSLSPFPVVTNDHKATRTCRDQSSIASRKHGWMRLFVKP